MTAIRFEVNSMTGLIRTGIVAICILGVACASRPTSLSGVTSEPTPIATTLILDPPLNRITFSPSGNQVPNLTEAEAIAKFTASPDVHLPDDLTVQLGLYTAAVGDGTYRFKDELAWGISWNTCMSVIGGDIASPSPLDKVPCTRWLFLDANTGEMLESEWQLGS
jgi:hypothetical protein